jgi:ribulose-phosphate 3-epimerase
MILRRKSFGILRVGPMVKIAPSILSANFAKLGEDIKSVELGGGDWLHVDVMDGHFVPNITIGPPVVKALRPLTKLPFDVHLMIEDPDKYLQEFIDAGANYLTVHAEACDHLHRTLTFIREKGVKAGVALNPSTPVNVLKHVLDEIDLIVIMTVNPGFGGQKFIKGLLPKIKEVKELVGPRPIEIEIDGGITADNSKICVEAGATVLVAGNAAFKGQGSIAQNIAAIRAFEMPDDAKDEY